MPETDPDPAIAAWCDRARRSLERHRPGLAADAAREALELAPGDIDARVLLADSLSQLGGEEALREACELAQALVEERPDHLEAWLVWADASYQIDQSEVAREAAVKALQLQSECAHAHALLAWLEIDDERWQLAIQHAEAALAIDPRQPNADSARQRARANLGLPDDRPRAGAAQKRAEQAAREGLEMQQQGRGSEALEKFGQALADDAGQLLARRGLAQSIGRDHPMAARLAGALLGLTELNWLVRLGILLAVYFGYRWISWAAEVDPAVVTLAAAAGAGLLAVLILSCCGPLAVDVVLRTVPWLRPVLPPLALSLSWISGWLVVAAVATGLLALARPQLALLVSALMLLALLMPLSGMLKELRPGLRGFVALYTLMAFGFTVATLIGTLVDWDQTPLVATAGVLTIVLFSWIQGRLGGEH